jgi:hypothetical protein
MFMGILAVLSDFLQQTQLTQNHTDRELADWADEQYGLPQAMRTPIRIDS